MPSRQSRRTRKVEPSMAIKSAIDVPSGFGWTGERRAKVHRTLPSSAALQHEVPSQQAQPINDFDARVCGETSERRYPRLEDLDATDRTVAAALPRRELARSPRCPDAPDELEPCIRRRRRRNGSSFVLISLSRTMTPEPHVVGQPHGQGAIKGRILFARERLQAPRKLDRDETRHFA